MYGKHLMLCLAFNFSFPAVAMEVCAAEIAPIEIYNGILIDQACAAAHGQDLIAYVKTHGKECALKAESQASGYSLITPEGAVTAFTPGSNAKIVAFLKKSKSKLRVTIKAKLVNAQLELAAIQNIVPIKSTPQKRAGSGTAKPSR